MVRAREAVGIARGGAGGLPAAAARGPRAARSPRSSSRGGTAGERLASRRHAQGSARSVQEEKPPRARVVRKGSRDAARPGQTGLQAACRPTLVRFSRRRRWEAAPGVARQTRRPAEARPEAGAFRIRRQATVDRETARQAGSAARRSAMDGKTARRSPVARRAFTAKRSAVADETDRTSCAAEAVGRKARCSAGLHASEAARRSALARQAGERRSAG